MVHALQKIHWLLAENGRLIDIHPNGEPPPIHIKLGDETHLAGWVQEYDDYASYEEAGAALETAVSEGLFVWEQQSKFAFTTYADSLEELQAYIATDWQNAYIEDAVVRRIAEWLDSIVPDKQIVLQEVINIARLNPVADSPQQPT